MDATLFAYPYGEWNESLRALVAGLGFTAAFGQHSGVVAAHSDRLNLPRFALNQNYGAADRFKLIVDTLPLRARAVTPTEQILEENPPTIGFTIEPPLASRGSLACYASGGVGAHPRPPGGRPRGGDLRRGVPAGPGPAQLHRARRRRALALVRPAIRCALTGARTASIRWAVACWVGRLPPSTGGCSATPGRSRRADSGG